MVEKKIWGKGWGLFVFASVRIRKWVCPLFFMQDELTNLMSLRVAGLRNKKRNTL